MAVIDLMRMLRAFATSAFRLEARQSYASDEEAAAFAAWQEHGRIHTACLLASRCGWSMPTCTPT
jgi:hypothetical protein